MSRSEPLFDPAMVEDWITPDVTERPWVLGWTYVAFAVHPLFPGPLLAIAIAHREGDKLVLDVARENITISD